MDMSLVSSGKYFRVLGFSESSEPMYRKRLLAMGLVPGARFFVKHLAPLGDPMNILVLGTSWMLRRKEAACLEVVPE